MDICATELGCGVVGLPSALSFDISYKCDGGTALCDLWPWCGRVWLHMDGDRASRKRQLLLMCHKSYKTLF